MMHLGHYFIISRVLEAVQFFRRWSHHPSFGRLVVVAWLPAFLELSNNRQLSVFLIIIQTFIYSVLSMMILFFLCLYRHSSVDAWMLSIKAAVRDQFSSVAQSCPTLWDPMNRSTPGLPVHHQLPEFTQTHIHRVSDAIQPSHPLSSPSPPAPNPSQHQNLFQWVNSSHEVVKVLEFQL